MIDRNRIRQICDRLRENKRWERGGGDDLKKE